MIFVAFAVAFLFVFLVQRAVYAKHAYDEVRYRMSLDTFEIFEDEEIYVYEELENKKMLPLPFVKVEASLPEGLTFHIVETDKRTGQLRETFPRVIHSIFVLKSNEMIRRRWRVRCNVRGTYVLGSATLVTDDILGSNLQAKVYTPEATGKNVLVVLPKAIDLGKHFTSSKYANGAFTVPASLLTDPLLKAGVREYANGDPMNRINWKQTAVHGSLMVNIEEYTQKQQFNIIMNMQSRDIEQRVPGPPTARNLVELAITVVASILDNVANDNVPVRFICNTPPFDAEMCTAVREGDEIGEKIFISPTYKGRGDMITALRMLAQMELMISVPIERMLDHIVENPYAYTSGGNIIFVSAYLSERMINFCYNLRKLGIHMIFYITSTSSNALIIPDDIEVHFKTFID